MLNFWLFNILKNMLTAYIYFNQATTNGPSSTTTNGEAATGTGGGDTKLEEMTSKDYYFDSYAHFGIHEVRVFINIYI